MMNENGESTEIGAKHRSNKNKCSNWGKSSVSTIAGHQIVRTYNGLCGCLPWHQ